MAAYLIGEGANVNSTNRQQQTPLLIACQEGNYEASKVLLHYSGRKKIRVADAFQNH